MPVRIVQSKQNSRLKELRRAFTQPARTGAGPIAIEGPNLLAEAMRAGLEIHCVFASRQTAHLLDQYHLPVTVEILLTPPEMLRSVLATETPQPIAALIDPPQWTWADLLQKSGTSTPLIFLLAGLQDPGNLGTILRSAEAFGATGVIALPGTVSAWNPKAIRASAGSVFRVPLVAADIDDTLRNLRKAGITLLTTAAQDARPANLVDLAAPIALIIGNEGNGVPEDLATRATGAVTIPCPGPVESLNAAVAASVLLYEASRQRAAKGGRQ